MSTAKKPAYAPSPNYNQMSSEKKLVNSISSKNFKQYEEK